MPADIEDPRVTEINKYGYPLEYYLWEKEEQEEIEEDE